MSDSHAPPRRRVVEVAKRPPAELRVVRAVVEPDLDPDTSWLSEKGLEERRRAYEKGEVSFNGVRVEAEVVIEGTEQTLTSPGLWGVESDLSEEELKTIVDEEWKALRNVLKAIGVATDQLPLEVQDEWIEWRT